MPYGKPKERREKHTCEAKEGATKEEIKKQN